MIRLIALVALCACHKQAEDKRPQGKLCFAANPPALFKWTNKLGEPVDFTQGEPLVFKFRGKGMPLHEQHGFDDVHEGEPVAVMRGDQLLESWKVSFMLGTDLCYAFRTWDPTKPDRRPGFILNTNLPDDRCTCY
jgi:hypothetical protein